MVGPNPELELAWAAGFFDGEGNARWRHNEGHRPRRTRAHGSFTLQIGQIDRAVLDRFCAAVGGGKVYGPYTKTNGSAKVTIYYSFQACGSKAVEAFDRIKPYLSAIKRRQGEEALLKLAAQQALPPLGNGLARRRELAALEASS